MLYVGYVLEKRLDVNAIIDNVVTFFGSALYHCHNWRERFVPLFCSTVLHASALIPTIYFFKLKTCCYVHLEINKVNFPNYTLNFGQTLSKFK